MVGVSVLLAVMARSSVWGRYGLLVGVLLVDGLLAAHWSASAFMLSMLFSASPALCWLLVAPRSIGGLVVGVILLGLSVIPGVEFGPGGPQMYRVSTAATWVAVLYLPVALTIVGGAAMTVTLRAARRRDEFTTGTAGRVLLTPVCLTVALVLACGCGMIQLHWTESMIPDAPVSVIVGALPGDLRVVEGPGFDNGSSVQATMYDIEAVPGQSAAIVADRLSRYLADLTGWQIPSGFGARCYRAGSLQGYTGRFCLEIEPAGADRARLRIEAWDNRFTDFSPEPG